MARRSSETAIFVQTTEDEVDDSIPRKSVRLAEKMEGSEAPVDPADTEVFSQMILKLVTSLLLVLVVSNGCKPDFSLCRAAYCVQTLDVGDMFVDHEFQFIRELTTSAAASAWPCC